MPDTKAPEPKPATTYTLHTNVDRTILLTVDPNGTITVAFRDTPRHTWGPPITLNQTA